MLALFRLKMVQFLNVAFSERILASNMGLSGLCWWGWFANPEGTDVALNVANFGRVECP